MILRVPLYSNSLSEFTFLHTDRSVYITGENIYYKLYVMNTITKKLSLNSKVGYIMLVSENATINLKIRAKVNNGMANGSFQLPDTLKSGNYQLLAFTLAMKNQSDSLIFRKKLTIINRSDKELDVARNLPSSPVLQGNLSAVDSMLQISIDSVYENRVSVTATIRTSCSMANVSLSVYEKPPFYSETPSIHDTFAKTSTINLNEKYSFTSIENRGKLLKGSVVSVINNEKVNDVVVVLSCLDSIPNIQYALSNTNGDFELLLDEYYDGKELFLTTMSTHNNTNLRIKIDDKYSFDTNSILKQKEINTDFSEFITKSQNLAYVNQIYEFEQDAEKIHVKEDKNLIHRFYNSNPITVFPDEYESLDNFGEIIVELLPQVRFSKKSGLFTMYNAITGQYGSRGAALFLDGVFIDNVSKLLNMGTNDIKKIDVLTEDRAFGDLIFGGLIAVTSKNKSMARSEPSENSMRIMNDTVNVGKKFTSIQPSKIQDARVPFFKQLLYWNPSLQICKSKTNSINFFTSDNEGTFIIQIEGVSENGIPISSKSTFNVENKKRMK